MSAITQVSDVRTQFEEPLILTQPQDQLLAVSGLLSIVLSHHFAKEDICRLIEGTEINFTAIRDTMYKYSKKAEEKFFSQPILAFMFIYFALTPDGIDYTKRKLAKSNEKGKK